MDCSKFCANFKAQAPFPDGLRTEDLEIGMVVRSGRRDSRTVYTILEAPNDKWVKVLRAYPGHTPTEDKISLADHGCQPYENGRWNGVSWLREVK